MSFEILGRIIEVWHELLLKLKPFWVIVSYLFLANSNITRENSEFSKKSVDINLVIWLKSSLLWFLVNLSLVLNWWCWLLHFLPFLWSVFWDSVNVRLLFFYSSPLHKLSFGTGTFLDWVRFWIAYIWLYTHWLVLGLFDLSVDVVSTAS